MHAQGHFAHRLILKTCSLEKGKNFAHAHSTLAARIIVTTDHVAARIDVTTGYVCGIEKPFCRDRGQELFHLPGKNDQDMDTYFCF